jgi:ferredoxin--NADP+ reductase
MRVAIVGAGPSGVFAVDALAARVPEDLSVDLFDALPVPCGLVRYGVAPDHYSVRTFRDNIDKSLDAPGLRFFGNVNVGRDVAISELCDDYDAVILSYGASSGRDLGIPGEDLTGSVAATDVVAWYTGHPDADRPRIEALVRATKSAIVVGLGNVAVDVARVLVKSTEELRQTDMPEHVLDLLAEHPVTDVHIVGRRGPAQGAFTTKELRELGELEGVDVVVDPRDVELGEHDLAEVAENRLIARNVDILREWSTRSLTGAPRRIHVHFWLRPTAISGDTHAESVQFARFARVADGSLQPTGETEDIAAQLIVKSVGYFGQPLEGVPFDERSGTIPNVDGRVSMPDGSGGLYVAGWIKRGPSGIIGTNKKDSIATVETMLADVAAGSANHPTKPGSVEALLAERGLTTTDVTGWRNIDQAERDLGSTKGRDRTTIHVREDLLAAARPTA